MIFLDPKSDIALKKLFDDIAHSQSLWSKEELEAYDRYLDAKRSAVSQLETAEQIGMAKGMAKGEAQGEIKKAIEIAKALLDVLDMPTIAKKTGLSIEDIKKLKK